MLHLIGRATDLANGLLDGLGAGQLHRHGVVDAALRGSLEASPKRSHVHHGAQPLGERLRGRHLRRAQAHVRAQVARRQLAELNGAPAAESAGEADAVARLQSAQRHGLGVEEVRARLEDRQHPPAHDREQDDEGLEVDRRHALGQASHASVDVLHGVRVRPQLEQLTDARHPSHAFAQPGLGVPDLLGHRGEEVVAVLQDVSLCPVGEAQPHGAEPLGGQDLQPFLQEGAATHDEGVAPAGQLVGLGQRGHHHHAAEVAVEVQGGGCTDGLRAVDLVEDERREPLTQAASPELGVEPDPRRVDGDELLLAEDSAFRVALRGEVDRVDVVTSLQGFLEGGHEPTVRPFHFGRVKSRFLCYD